MENQKKNSNSNKKKLLLLRYNKSKINFIPK